MIVFLRTIILYTFVVVAIRIMGKRQIGELQPFELVIAIMLSELAAIPMQDTGIPLVYGIIPIVTLALLEVILSFIALKFNWVRKILCGVPSIIIEHGKIQIEEMRKQRFNLTDLMEELRLQGYFNISDIEYAIIEDSGKISILPKSDATNITKSDLNIKSPQNKMPLGIILDGKLIKENLLLSNHDEKWLQKKLAEKKVKSTKDVFFAMIDSKGNFYLQKR